MKYQETQIGTPMILLFGSSFTGMLLIMNLFGANIIFIIITITIFFLLILYSHSIITIDEYYLTIKLGSILQKKILLTEIKSVSFDPKETYTVWGLYYTPKKTLISVVGYAGVKITLNTNQQVIVGAKSAENLVNEIENARRNIVAYKVKPSK